MFLQLETGSSTLDSLVTNSLIPERYQQLNKEQIQHLFKISISYLLKLIDFKTMSKNLKTQAGITNQETYLLRQELVSRYETALCLKQFLLIAANRIRRNKSLKIENLLRRCDLPETDLGLWKFVQSLGLIPEIITKCLRYVKIWPLRSPSQVQKECAEALRKLNPYINHITAKQLLFIATGNNFSLSDLSGDLRLKATQTFYFSTPFQSELYRFNTVIRAVDNHAVKLISHYQTQGRARKLRDDESGGYYNRIQTIHKNPGQETRESDNSDGIERDDLIADSIENELILAESRIVDTVLTLEHFVKAGPPNRKRIVDLLLLQPDNDFVTAAKKLARIRRVDTPEDVYERVGYEKYLDLISLHTHVPLLTLQRLTASLRRELSN